MSDRVVVKRQPEGVLYGALGSLAFVALCTWLLISAHSGDLEAWVANSSRGWFGYYGVWFGLVFFMWTGWAFLKDIAAVLRERAQLEIDESGFIERDGSRERWLRWDEVSAFELHIPARKFHAVTPIIVFDILHGEVGAWGRMNKSFAGKNAYLRQGYELQPQDLADLLNQCRDAALGNSLEREENCERS